MKSTVTLRYRWILCARVVRVLAGISSVAQPQSNGGQGGRRGALGLQELEKGSLQGSCRVADQTSVMWNQQGNEHGSGHLGYGQMNGGAANCGPSGESYGGPYTNHNVYGVNGVPGQVSSNVDKDHAYGGEHQSSAQLGLRIGDEVGPYSGPAYAYGSENVSFDAYGELAQPAYGYSQPGLVEQGHYGHNMQTYRSDERNAQNESYQHYEQPSVPPVSYVSHEYASSARPISYDHPGSAHSEPPSSTAFAGSTAKDSNGVEVERDSGRTESKGSEKLTERPTADLLNQKADSNAGAEDHPKSAPVPKQALMTIKKNPSNGKATGPRLAFGFKSASKVKATINPLKAALETDELEREEAEKKEEAERAAKRQKLGIAPPPSEAPARAPAAPPPAPEDAEVCRIAEKLAKFVAKNGRGLENTTRQRNPGDTPFRFLFDPSSSDYKYYEYCIGLEEKALQEAASSAQAPQEAGRPVQTPPAQPQAQPVERRRGFSDAPPPGRPEPSGVSSSQDDKLSQEDSLAKMEFYARQAARANASREPRENTREMPPPEANQDPGGPPRRGHHMGDFIPEEELQTFLSMTTPGARIPPPEDRNKIGSSNVGHKLLSKMGWTEGSGLGAGGAGMIDPLAAGGAKLDGLGVGAAQTHEPTSSDDIYEQYKKRMMLGYKHRPNPLGNPRKAYY
ncbi:hypothetical protein KFL_000400050 [Klebsormidium nitens]|uniref:SURP and G-patch domain-containing protein 1-like protein n=1 Tax=Klebsormidium nitens TaxID=105231 RepID=A0A1Y1HQ05_KLENI|nr:hypothetical protein KFL_000400050 [Klebsormidium nitens]|eukprot:GAQ79862.1 hypothetical protein KFL_000400050 [Klebsormidium nitens]